MVRGGVFIGVNRTGQLQELKDAAGGARRMRDWAIAQRMPETHAKLITDDEGRKKVTADEIYEAISTLISGAGLDQLIVYFAGHGVNIARSERWLLTDAPEKASAAVNLAGSVELARYCGVSHVVLISDACRVAPEGIRASGVRGIEIFPNLGAVDKAKPVDQFFACRLGRTAAEIQDPAEAALGFCALYTDALLDGLRGQVPRLLRPSTVNGDTALYVTPEPLESYLEEEVPRRLRARRLQYRYNQEPDALIMAHPNWISRIEPPVPPPLAAEAAQPNVRRGEAAFGLPDEITNGLVSAALGLSATPLDSLLSYYSDFGKGRDVEIARTAALLATSFGPDRFDAPCGIKTRGRRIASVLSLRARATIADRDTTVVHIDTREPTTVLVEFEDGTGAVVPVFPRFATALTFGERELLSIDYEQLVSRPLAMIRDLRAIAAAVSNHGPFRLDTALIGDMLEFVTTAPTPDPTLTLYAAYACHDLQELDAIRRMREQLLRTVGAVFFDIALLGRTPADKSDRMVDEPRIVPFAPMLARGWPLLRAHSVQLPPALARLENTLIDSVWSWYDRDGVAALTDLIRTRENL